MGIGFWKGAVVALLFIMLTLRVLVKLDQNLHSHAKSFELYVEFDEGADIRQFIKVDITLANLSVLKNNKAKAVRFSTLEAVCAALDCQPGDILEYVPDETGGAE